ncbi:MAG: putative 25 [Actinomycetia bacterium]|nr:putative 25 [Actinomycetes bacterium]
MVERTVTERSAGRDCAWCGTWIVHTGKGRPRRTCSKACRNRVSELKTASARLDRDLAAGRIPTQPRREVVERTVTEIREAVPTRAGEWETLLEELARQLLDVDAKRGLAHRPYDHARIYHAL